MKEIEGLNNREISVAIWLGILVLFMAYKTKSFDWGKGLLRALFASKIFIIYLLSVIYTSVGIYLLYQIGWWSIAQLKDAILWCTFTIFKTLMTLSKADENKNYFKDALLENLKFTLIIEFIAETYTFSLPVELILIPVMALLGGMQAIAQHDKQHSNMVPILAKLVMWFGAGLIIHAIWEIIRLRDYANLGKLKEFTFPPILAIWFLPWLYLLATFMRFENAFTSFKIKLKEKGIYQAARKKAIRAFLFNPEGLKRWTKMLFIKDVQTEDELITTIKEIKRLQKTEKMPPKVNPLEGWSPYEAKDFLKDAAVETRFYENVYENEWSASSNYLKIDDEFAGNTIAYYVSGNETTATELKLYLSITSPGNKITALNYLDKLADLLCMKALRQRLPASLHKKIRLSKNGDEQIRHYHLTLHKDGYDSGQGRFGYSFTIQVDKMAVTDKIG